MATAGNGISDEQKNDKTADISESVTGVPLPESKVGTSPEEMEALRRFLARSMGLDIYPQPESRLDEVSFEGIARYIASDKCQKIVTMTGAGISTSAGIPDFRSPGTGLYDNLKKYNLPTPESAFNVSYFDKDPEPFFTLRKQIWAVDYKPTVCHYFIKLLDMKGKLLQHFTQNIDSLEREAGIEDDKMVEAHGSFATGHCRVCDQKYDKTWMREKMFAEDKLVPICDKEGCEGVVKPDIVFFGESLPEKFGKSLHYLTECDLLLIMGTSLVVQPFAALTSRVGEDVPRVYINMERTGPSNPHPISVLMFGGGFEFDKEDNIRDVFWKGTCDDGCTTLAELIGWGDELKDLVDTEHARIDGLNNTGPNKVSGVKSSVNPSKGLEGLASKGPSNKGPPPTKGPSSKAAPTKGPSSNEPKVSAKGSSSATVSSSSSPSTRVGAAKTTKGTPSTKRAGFESAVKHKAKSSK